MISSTNIKRSKNKISGIVQDGTDNPLVIIQI